MKIKEKKTLTPKALQIAILQFFLAHDEKQYSASQVLSHLKIENNIDSIKYSLDQLTRIGSLSLTPKQKYRLVLTKFTNATDEDVTTISPSSNTLTPEDNKPVTYDDNDLYPKNKSNKNLNIITKAEKKAALGKDRKPEKTTSNTRGHSSKTISGRVDMTRSGSAYIVSPDTEQDVFIAPRNLGGAINGDTVTVTILQEKPSKYKRGNSAPKRPEGIVFKIEKRATEHFIGIFRQGRKYDFFAAENLPVDVLIPTTDNMGAQHGDKVVVRITDWKEGRQVPMGKVTQVLGKEGGNDYEMNKILITQGFMLEFPDDVIAESEAIPSNISAQEVAMRRDFRQTLTFTIDPADARDFDDAISYKVLEDGNIEIGVHIADVTHYLREGTPLDVEAYKRSTSVYLVDRVCPMLPEKLSNHLCSLVPHEDRLVFSAVFTFDAKHKLINRWFGKAVIHSHKRFAYEEAQTVIENNPSDELKALPIYPELEKALHTLQKMALKMRKEREKEGAISFETDEVRFRLAEDGTPLEAYVKERKDAHKLIEDFMLLANKEVSIYMSEKAKGQQPIPFVYRIHDLPDMEKVADFARFAAEMGVKLRVDTPKQIANSYNTLMAMAQKDDRYKLLEPLAIRTMAKAIYSTENIGHYGLGFAHYSHFTSPIRRYSDVLAHRILHHNLEGGTKRMDKDKLEAMCKHISSQERRAADAERESIKYKQTEYLKTRIGQVFDGVISGMIERGMFIELKDSKAEGMVEFNSLDDHYILESGNLQARGRRSKNIYKMGDTVQVRILAVDMERRQTEMELVN